MAYRKIIVALIFIAPLFIAMANVNLFATPEIFPLPWEAEYLDQSFMLTEGTPVILPENPSEHDVFLARQLVAEVSDRYGLALRVVRTDRIPTGTPAILIGTIANPHIQFWLRGRGDQITAANPGPEGYMLQVTPNGVIVAGCDEPGTFYGFQSLRQLIGEEGKAVYIRGARVKDRPRMPFRGIRLYVPGRENIPYFKRFIRDFMALYKYNTLIMEMNAVMRFDRHPELNVGAGEFAEYLTYTRQSGLKGPMGEHMNSTHHDAGDGGILEKEEVADIVAYARRYHIDVIPEIPSLTHSYYLLNKHRELAEDPQFEWADTYCPLLDGSYELLFDVLDEYIEVMQPRRIHIGHDEWWMPMDVCDRCRGKDHADLFVQDVLKIYHHLAARGVKTAMWGDHLMESVRGKRIREQKRNDGSTYRVPHAVSPEMVKAFIPKDILILNWSWWKVEGAEQEISDLGFQQIYGNLIPAITDWDTRIHGVNAIGGAVSSWEAATELNFGKDLMFFFLSCENLLWSPHTLTREKQTEWVLKLMPDVRRRLSGRKMPSDLGDPIMPINLTGAYNLSLDDPQLSVPFDKTITGEVRVGKKVFTLPNQSGKNAVVVGMESQENNPLPPANEGIAVGEDVSSLIFLHAAARPASNEKAYFFLHNFQETADLLGWYEIVYEDGFIETVPVRYGVNIMTWDIRHGKEMPGYTGRQVHPQNQYAYEADAVKIAADADGSPVWFFAWEWKNPRFGKKIREIKLKGTQQFRGVRGKSMEPVDNNAIILLAVSAVQVRSVSGK
jgi:hypothetical protein